MKAMDLIYDEKEKSFYLGLFGTQVLGEKIEARIGKEKAILLEVVKDNQADNKGTHTCFYVTYAKPSNGAKTFSGRIMIYDDYMVFEVTHLFEVKGKKKRGFLPKPYIAFPAFEGHFQDANYHMLSFKSQMPFNFPVMWHGKATSSFREGSYVPLILVGKAYETVIISPLSHLLEGTVSIAHYPEAILCGLPKTGGTIYKDTVYQTILVTGTEVNKTIDRWGGLLQGAHHTKPVEKDADVSLKYLSYWTNAGSAYWYKARKRSDYETTLKQLKAYHTEVGLKIGSYQLDSWWYQKDGDMYTSGITKWEPKTETKGKNYNALLPFFQKYRTWALFETDRLSHVQGFLKTPIGCHFKQLSKEAAYVEAHPQDFIIEAFALPKDYDAAKRLFENFLNHPKWRLAFIVHDWLQWMQDEHHGFRNEKIAKAYLKALDDVSCRIEAPDNTCGHLTVQLCMTKPNMTLNSVTMNSVTTIRSTSDANSFMVEGAKRWWWHLYASRFIQALGKYAFYDHRLTYKPNWYSKRPYLQFELIWLALSCGPIGIGDPIGKTQVGLLKKVIHDQGEILKPDAPCVLLDQCYRYNPYAFRNKKAVTVFAHTHYQMENGAYNFIYLLTFNCHPIKRKVTMHYTLAETNLTTQPNYVLYDYLNQSAQLIEVDANIALTLKRHNFYYHIAVPLMHGMAFLGDGSKHVVGSGSLFKAINITKEGMHIVPIVPGSYEGIVYTKNKPTSVWVNGVLRAFKWQSGLIRFKTTLEVALWYDLKFTYS